MSRQIKWWEWPSMNVRSDMGVGLVDFMGGDAAVVKVGPHQHAGSCGCGRRRERGADPVPDAEQPCHAVRE